jgi:hypothetical protein
MRTLYRRVHQVAVWRRPKLMARGVAPPDPLASLFAVASQSDSGQKSLGGATATVRTDTMRFHA